MHAAPQWLRFHLWLECLRQRNGLASITCFPNHRDISYSFEPRMQPMANQGFIINQEQRAWSSHLRHAAQAPSVVFLRPLVVHW